MTTNFQPTRKEGTVARDDSNRDKSLIKKGGSSLSLAQKKQRTAYAPSAQANRGKRDNKFFNSVKSKNLGQKKSLRVGDLCELKITALAPNNIGIDEFSYPYAVFVPNAKYGSIIKAKIVKINSGTFGAERKSSPKASAGLYAVATLKEEIKQAEELKHVPVKPGDVLNVSIKKQTADGRAGIVELSNNFCLIVPVLGTPGNNAFTDNVNIIVTRVKAEYGFAHILNESSSPSNMKETMTINNKTRNGSNSSCKIVKGCKFTTLVPKHLKQHGNFLIFKIQEQILFVKLGKGSPYLSVAFGEERLGARLSANSKDSGWKSHLLNQTKGVNKVRIKVIATSGLNNVAIGKIIQVNPILQNKKEMLVLNNIRDMINHGMHFGEKAVKCHARMKHYIWFKKSSVGQSACLSIGTQEHSPYLSVAFGEERLGARLSAKAHDMRDSGNRPLIKKGCHVLNLFKTRRCLNKSLHVLTKYALKGRTFLFIGTKKPAAGLVARASFFTKNSFYVNTRWLGGMLTNWKTICKSISKIRPILKEKQKVIRDILERRQIIKSRLIKKALLLRKKSKLILAKGRNLISLFKNSNSNFLIEKSQKLTALRNECLSKGMNYIEKRKNIMFKQRKLKVQTLLMKEKGLQILSKYQTLLNQLTLYTKKLREYKSFLWLTAEIKNSLATPYATTAKGAQPVTDSNKKLLTVSYTKLKETKNAYNNSLWMIPNPPKEILNKMVLIMKHKFTSSLPRSQASNSFIIGKSSSGTPDLSVQGSGNFSSLERIAASLAEGELISRGDKKQIVVCSTLLSKFSNFYNYIKLVIKSLTLSIKSLETLCQNLFEQLNKIQLALQASLSLNKIYVNKLQLLKTKLTKERTIIVLLKRKINVLNAQKKLIKFLPRLRYLPTPQTKISEIVQILLSKMVDPKLKYPIDNIYDQKLRTHSKKLALSRKKKWQRLEKYFGGIVNMTKLTKTKISKNIAIILGQTEEMNAVRECQKLGIKMFTIVDTNCNPTLSDHVIPANDDSRNSIKYILTKFITRIRLAQKIRLRLQKLKKM